MKDHSNFFFQQEHNDDEAEETLSFCDLPIYSQNSSNCLLTTSSIEPKNDESFEFFTTDFTFYQSPKRFDHIVFRTKSSDDLERIKGSKINGKLSEKNGSKLKYRYLLMLGLLRFNVPSKMELGDMKYRQSRSKSNAKSMEMLAKSKNSKSDKGLSYLIRSLSCKSRHSINVLE